MEFFELFIDNGVIFSGVNMAKGIGKRAGMREICKKCSQREVAINYHKNGLTYYRSVCDHCSKKRIKRVFPWEKAGYKKKSICDRCGFHSRHQEQFNVFHIDGNLLNCRHINLKTVCANCQRIFNKEETKWRRGDLVPDF